MIHTLHIEHLNRRKGTVWEVTVRGMLLVIDFPLIDPQLGDELELIDTPVVLMVLHEGVVIHTMSKLAPGTQLFAKEDFIECGVTQNQKGTFVGVTPRIWEDDRGDQHEGTLLFQVEVLRKDGPETITCNIMDGDRIWGTAPIHHSLDLILEDWDANL